LPCDIPNHASYLQSWIAVLKQDRREIFHAAAEAQRMADYNHCHDFPYARAMICFRSLA
jgi:antirestriction protein ArdC